MKSSILCTLLNQGSTILTRLFVLETDDPEQGEMV